MNREEKMNKRREAGKTYSYKKNPYKEGTKEYVTECMERAEKTKSKKLPFVKTRSIFAKLDNQLEADRAAYAKKKHDKENAKKENK